MKRIKKNLLMSLVLAGTFMFASVLTATASVVADKVSNTPAYQLGLLEQVYLDSGLDIMTAEKDQDPKKTVKAGKDTKKAGAEDCKTAERKAADCKGEKSKNCEGEAKAKVKEGCEEKKCGEGKS